MKMKEKPKKENSERWLLTYSDLITLLLALFVVLYAMSNVDQAKYEQLAESLGESLGEGASLFDGGGSSGVLPDSGGTNPVDIGGGTGNNGSGATGISAEPTQAPKATQAPEPSKTSEDDQSTQENQDAQNSQGSDELSGSLETEKDMQNFEEYVSAIVDRLNLSVSVDTSMTENGLTITFKNDVFFDSGQDVIKKDMKKSLGQIADLLNKVDNNILIEGSTDNVRINSNNKYASNWQLSAARAANVAQYLVEEENVKGSRISAIGYGEYKPVASNATAAGRSKNRRVDIIVLYKDARK